VVFVSPSFHDARPCRQEILAPGADRGNRFTRDHFKIGIVFTGFLVIPGLIAQSHYIDNLHQAVLQGIRVIVECTGNRTCGTFAVDFAR
jgi:hypothetical protein